MRIVEIFKSIEGEGIRTGRIATFIRSFGCNFHCVYCDSLYAVDGQYASQYPDMTVEEIVNKCVELKTPYVTFTGGEPLIQPQAKELVETLLKNGFEVNIETNGGVDIGKFRDSLNLEGVTHYPLIFTIDYKSKYSGYNDKMIPENFSKNLRANDVVKFVVANQEDLDDMKKVVLSMRNNDFTTHIFVSPVFGMIEGKDIVEYLKENDLFDVRVQIQLHKVFWDPNMKGV